MRKAAGSTRQRFNQSTVHINIQVKNIYTYTKLVCESKERRTLAGSGRAVRFVVQKIVDTPKSV